MKKPRVMYSWPTGGHPKPAFVLTMCKIRMEQTLADHRPRDIMSATGPVNMARTTMCAEVANGICFRNHDHGDGTCEREQIDYLVMHDDDLSLGICGAGNPIDNSLAIMEADPTVGIVGAVYLAENPRVPTLNMYHPEYGVREHCRALAKFPGEPFDVGGVGFGWVMIRVEAIKKLYAINDGPVVRFAHRQDIGGTVIEVGEDYDFCDRVHALGYRVLADPRYLTEHWKTSGVLRYQHDEYEAQMADPGSELVIHAPNGSKIVQINGIDCLDISGSRKRVAEVEAKAAA